MILAFGRLRPRLGCIRRGHALICTSLGHVCTRCGSSWERMP